MHAAGIESIVPHLSFGPLGRDLLPVEDKRNSCGIADANDSLFVPLRAALAWPTRTLIARSARMEVCAGAIRVSSVTNWPSAEAETQEFAAARMTSVRASAVFWDVFLGGFPRFVTVTSLESASRGV